MEKVLSIIIRIIVLIKFDERFKVTSVPFFIPDFSLLSCELGFYIESVILGHFILIL